MVINMQPIIPSCVYYPGRTWAGWIESVCGTPYTRLHSNAEARPAFCGWLLKDNMEYYQDMDNYKYSIVERLCDILSKIYLLFAFYQINQEKLYEKRGKRIHSTRCILTSTVNTLMHQINLFPIHFYCSHQMMHRTQIISTTCACRFNLCFESKTLFIRQSYCSIVG